MENDHKSPSPQQKRVINYLLQNKSITQFEAIHELGIIRLSAIIYDLKHKLHYDIITKTVAIKNRFGETAYVAEYRLDGK
jgi:hypothetical protein